ncbi:hypothetical protein [Clostridium perfringens]|uniref:hypothetical protein n=1 Tax=Clostridium perfringens TaxID=1502 RepID=UPI001F056303|nr:hypothetical protein [Clostridium perfringens]MCH1962391.1 hypothetical protein [Clostridium perfringens]MDK0734403.1 hypothetical protein [Clostridium perfringens]MDM0463215.1 hypothetical protein [Clostridium perfringens]
MEYKISIDGKDLKKCKFLKKQFGKLMVENRGERYEKKIERYFEMPLILILTAYLALAIINKKIFSIEFLYIILFISSLFYFLFVLFFIGIKLVNYLVNHYMYVKAYSYLIGDFNIAVNEKEFIMESKNKVLKVNKKGATIKLLDDNLIIIDKNNFLIMLPINKLENFEEFKKHIVKKGKN